MWLAAGAGEETRAHSTSPLATAPVRTQRTGMHAHTQLPQPASGLPLAVAGAAAAAVAAWCNAGGESGPSRY